MTSRRVAVAVTVLLLLACGDDRYQFDKDEQGRSVRLDRKTGEVVLVDELTSTKQGESAAAPSPSASASQVSEARVARSTGREKITAVLSRVSVETGAQLMADGGLSVAVADAQRHFDKNRDSFANERFVSAYDDALFAANGIVAALERASDGLPGAADSDVGSAMQLAKALSEVDSLKAKLGSAQIAMIAADAFK